MSKIEEMAAEYKKMHPSATTFGNKEVNREVEYAYIDGANAILREIEDVLPHLAKNGVIYSILKDKIKELKGE